MRLFAALTLAGAIAPASAHAQRLMLELRPRAGDTLRMRLDQTTEMSGSRGGVSTKAVVTTLRMFSRAMVESSTPAASIIVAVTDSVDVSTTDEHGRSLARETQRQLEGRRMRLRVAPDGTVSLADQASTVPREVSDMVAVMPASFPRTMLAVGDTWAREMPIPPSASLGVPLGGLVRARFRLDSLRGDVAFVSMKGTIQDAAASAANQPTLDGSVNGAMVVDRKRGWLSESRFLISMRALLPKPAGSRGEGAHLRLTISQHMRVVDARR